MTNMERLEEHYQYDAAKKRYADIYRMATLINEYITKTGHVPEIQPLPHDDPMWKTWEVTVLGQDEAVEKIYQEGTPFMVTLRKFRAPELIAVLEKGLGRKVSLPLDPQNIGVTFPPVYMIWMRPASDGHEAYVVVSAFFAQEVKRSGKLAPKVYMVGISNQADVRFHVPVMTLNDIPIDEAHQILADGDAEDARFEQWVKVRTP